MKKLFLCITVLASIFFNSCTNTLDEVLVSDNTTNLSQESLAQSDFLTNETLSEDEVMFIGQMFANKQFSASRSNNSTEIVDIHPFMTDGGRILAYAVNYKEGGYSIISANQKYYPVIAYSESGRIDTDYTEINPNFSFFMDLMKEDIVLQLNKPDDTQDSTVQDIKRLWKGYAANAMRAGHKPSLFANQDHAYWYGQERYKAMMSDFTDPSRMMSDDLDLYNRVVTSDYNSAGILSNSEIQNLKGQNSTLKNKYARIGVLPSNVASYFWTEYSKEFNDYNSGELVKTKWDQGEPYNRFNSMNTSGTGHQLLGCVTLAVAQIMNFYQYPQTIRRYPTSSLTVDWSNVNITSLSAKDTLNNDLPEFLRFVNIGVKTENGDEGSSSNIDYAKAFLTLNGYNVHKYDGFHTERFIQEIKANRPLYVRGTNAANEGHAFICCGYKAVSNKVSIELKTTNSLDIKNYSSNPYFIYRRANGSRTVSQEYFYFNWGWGILNAWIIKPANGIPDLQGFNNKIKYLTIQRP